MPHRNYNLIAPRNIPRYSNPYPYESERSCSLSQLSSGSYLDIPPLRPPSVESHQTTEPLIHLASSHLNHRHQSTSSATGNRHPSNYDSWLTQDPQYTRNQTQWHPPFHHHPTSISRNATSSARYLPPPELHVLAQHQTGQKSPSSMLTSDPFITLFQTISDINIKLHDIILKQQETLVEQQCTLTEFLQMETKLCRDQAVLMQKQLDAIMALAPTTAQVSKSHFEPSSVDEISFASSWSPPLHNCRLNLYGMGRDP